MDALRLYPEKVAADSGYHGVASPLSRARQILNELVYEGGIIRLDSMIFAKTVYSDTTTGLPCYNGPAQQLNVINYQPC